MKVPAGLTTKPDWLRLSTHVVIAPSPPQLTVLIADPRSGRQRLDRAAAEDRRRRCEKLGDAADDPPTRFAPSGAPGSGPLQP